MQKLTSISVALDVYNEKKIDNLSKNINRMFQQIKAYNKEVEKEQFLFDDLQ